jgi:NAD(P)-dependent dehydrogenase (short-subunit alcohol dehydrogenase family)
LIVELAGKTLMVTGGTGCIGSHLLDLLTRGGARTIVSVSRGVTMPIRTVRGAQYACADVRDRRQLTRLVEQIRPDAIFHLAAVRDPARAEKYPAVALGTNLLGTRNVLGAAASCGVSRVVYASTGKAVRYSTPDIYAATKKLGEWMAAATVAATDVSVSAVRFTHVVDNSLIHAKLKIQAREGLLSLHGPDIAMYAQSALESAQLLLIAAGTENRGTGLAISTLRNLECYFELLDIALGVRFRYGPTAAIRFTGFEPGYEEVTSPGQYDPFQSAETGPLVNILEASGTSAAHMGNVNEFRLRILSDSNMPAHMDSLLRALEDGASPRLLRSLLDGAMWQLLNEAFLGADPACLERVARLALNVPLRLTEHDDINSVLRSALHRQRATVA